MKLLRFLVFGILVFMLWPECIAAEWQWSVQIPGIISNETDDHPQAFLWIPSGVLGKRCDDRYSQYDRGNPV